MKHVQRYWVAAVIGLWLWAIAPLPVMAQTTTAPQGNQELNIPASLVAPDPDMEISIYPQPNTRRPRIGFGLNGDPVTVIEQTGSNGGTTWNRIQFAGSEDAEGWVQLDYLSIQPKGSQDYNDQPNDGRDRYMGSRTSQSPTTSSRQSYGQQDQRQQQEQRRQY